MGGVGGRVVDIKDEAAAAIGRGHRACDEHADQVHVFLILTHKDGGVNVDGQSFLQLLHVSDDGLQLG